MSKLADALRDIRIRNNWDMLMMFGEGNDVAVKYYRPPEGRSGWGRFQHTAVWAPTKKHPVVPLDDKWPHSYAVKRFLGPRASSVPEALKWVAVNIGGEFVPSPFGGYLPKPVVDRAKAAAKAKP
jgi:hypothetical protein